MGEYEYQEIGVTISVNNNGVGKYAHRKNVKCVMCQMVGQKDFGEICQKNLTTK